MSSLSLLTFAEIQRQRIVQRLRLDYQPDPAIPRPAKAPVKRGRPLGDFHGTLRGYCVHRCRCEDCRAANVVHRQKYRARHRRHLSTHKEQSHV